MGVDANPIIYKQLNVAGALVLKAQGVQGLTKDLGWLYSYLNPSTICNMKPQY